MSKLIVLWLVCACFGTISNRPAEQYTLKYDNLDVGRVLKSDRLLSNYLNCLLGSGHCTPEGQELKTHLPDALQTACAKCTEKQKSIGYQVVDFLIENKPNEWKKLEAKFDPDAVYRTKYKSELDERKSMATSEE